jgi:hypothetical protein
MARTSQTATRTGACVTGGEAGGDSLFMEAAQAAGFRNVVYTFERRLKRRQAEMAHEVVVLRVPRAGRIDDKYSARIRALVESGPYTAMYAIGRLGARGEVTGGTGETIRAFAKRWPDAPVYLLPASGDMPRGWLRLARGTGPVGWERVRGGAPPPPSGRFVGAGMSDAARAQFEGPLRAIFSPGSGFSPDGGQLSENLGGGAEASSRQTNADTHNSRWR